MILADTLDIGCERKAKVIDYSNFGPSSWVNLVSFIECDIKVKTGLWSRVENMSTVLL